MTDIKKILLIALSLFIVLSVIPIDIWVYAGDEIDYKDERPPEGVIRPTVGMKIRIEHQDGSASERWVTGDDPRDPLQAYVGDKVTITDWSQCGTGDRLKRWDFQYYDSNDYHTELKSANEGAIIKTLTLSNVGTYEFYLCVEDDNTVGLWQNWSSNGSHDAVKDLDNGKTYVMHFVRLDIEVSIQPPPEEKYIQAFINGPSQVDKGDSFTLDSSSSISSSPIVSRKWYVDGVHKSSWDNKVSITDSISDTTTYRLEIQNEQGLTDFEEKTVIQMGGDNVDYIHCSFDIDSTIEYSTGMFGGYNSNYSDDSYVEGKESEPYDGIKSWVVNVYDASNDSKDTTFTVTSSEIDDSGKSKDYYIRNKIDEILEGWYSSPGTYQVGIYQRTYDEDGNYDGSLEFTDVIYQNDPPRTTIDIPDPFYPKQVIGYDENKTITWSYSSSEGTPYKESIVSLYKVIDDTTDSVIFKDQVVNDRELIVDRDAGEKLRIEVVVVDSNNTKSNVESKIFTIAGGYPNIDLTLTRDAGILNTNVTNLNDPIIEAVIPTTYSKWEIKNSSDEIVLDGLGEITKTIILDDITFPIGVYTATQYAENSLGNTGYDTEQFDIYSELDFSFSEFMPFETVLVEIIDKCKGITNMKWEIRNVEDVDFTPLTLDGDNKFTMDKGSYNVKLTGDGYFSDGFNTYSVMKNITFLNAKPISDFVVGGNKKMYKEILLDGTVSNDATDSYLQSKYPILYTDPRTQFTIEPLNEDGTEVDYTKNEYILGEDKELIDNKVTFRAVGFKKIRIDKEGWYRVSFKVANALKESDWKSRDIYVSPEMSLDLDISVQNPITYRDPNNDLKSKLTVVVSYNSPDGDLIDEVKSKLYISYDINGNGDFKDDGGNSNQYYSKNDSNMQSYIDSIESTYTANQATFNIYIDNPDKNIFGYFKFDFEGIEKPGIPNYDDLGSVPIVKSDTFLLDADNKKMLIDNNKPVLNLQTSSSNAIEIFILEESYNPIDAQQLLDKLKLNNLSPKIYIIKKDGTVEIIE